MNQHDGQGWEVFVKWSNLKDRALGEISKQDWGYIPDEGSAHFINQTWANESKLIVDKGRVKQSDIPIFKCEERVSKQNYQLNVSPIVDSNKKGDLKPTKDTLTFMKSNLKLLSVPGKLNLKHSKLSYYDKKDRFKRSKFNWKSENTAIKLKKLNQLDSFRILQKLRNVDV
jgi:hypothetical protein